MGRKPLFDISPKGRRNQPTASTHPVRKHPQAHNAMFYRNCSPVIPAFAGMTGEQLRVTYEKSLF
jgi:hypothetical protein